MISLQPPCGLRTTAAASRIAVIALVAFLAGCDSNDPSEPGQPVIHDFDLGNNAADWKADFADYPQGREADVDFVAGLRTLPEELEGDSALYHRGHNISDDLFMYFVRPIDGLEPGALYQASFRLDFASNHGEDCAFGVGSSVYLKAGASTIEPVGRPDSTGMIRLNIDKGQQRNSGSNALLLGDIRNGRPGCDGKAPFAVATRESEEATISVETDELGRLWLFFGSESAFETAHELYFTRFRVELEEGS